MSVVPHEEMSRADLIATLGATEAKLRASQERIAVLEARVKELAPLARRPPMADDIHDD